MLGTAVSEVVLAACGSVLTGDAAPEALGAGAETEVCGLAPPWLALPACAVDTGWVVVAGAAMAAVVVRLFWATAAPCPGSFCALVFGGFFSALTFTGSDNCRPANVPSVAAGGVFFSTRST